MSSHFQIGRRLVALWVEGGVRFPSIVSVNGDSASQKVAWIAATPRSATPIGAGRMRESSACDTMGDFRPASLGDFMRYRSVRMLRSPFISALLRRLRSPNQPLQPTALLSRG